METTFKCSDVLHQKAWFYRGKSLRLCLSFHQTPLIYGYIENTFNTKESLWNFNIGKHSISVPVLLVGKTTEPNVFIDRVSINFKSQLVGHPLKEHVNLINNESIPFNFSFSETSFELGNDGAPVLKFSPTSGTIGANSEFPIEIKFKPSAEKVFNFNLVCNVRKKSAPVTINIKGEGYMIHDSLSSEMTNDGALFELASGSTAENIIDFGQVQLNEKRIKRITISNAGKFNFDYAWKFLSRGSIAISPDIGTVSKGDHVTCDISFHPTTANNSAVKVKGVCQILNGRSYPFTITGKGVQPLLTFSMMEVDFGMKFIYRSGMPLNISTVKITNSDVNEISYEVIFPTSTVFELVRGPNSLAPGASANLEVFFYPRDSTDYSETIKFEINGLSTIEIPLCGGGTTFQVETVLQEHRSINFGAVRVGHVVSRQLKLVNKSEIPATFSLGPQAMLDNLAALAISLSPAASNITLRPKGVHTFDLKFTPITRFSPFSEELSLESPGISRPIALIQGACQGIDIKLENDTLPFGAVVYKSATTRRMQLQNTGDIGARFKWDLIKFQPDFSVTPAEGYISPGMDIPLEITFHPTEINPDIRYENLVCKLEGTLPVTLTLTGMCIPQPAQVETIKFATAVRQSEVKTIPLANKTTLFWRIRPIIDNAFWSGPDLVDVEPGQTKSVDVSFLPLEMTGDGPRHEGSIFFPLPDGTGILYKLSGSADKPLVAGTLTHEIPCKTSHIELLPVQNWLKKTQRFKVFIEVGKPDPSVVVKGHDFIDVPALQTREYKLSFYSFKEGLTNVKVVFKNETTQEFVYYNISFKSTSPGVIATYEINSVVRSQQTREIILTNPLATPVTFAATCSHADVSVPHSFTILPK